MKNSNLEFLEMHIEFVNKQQTERPNHHVQIKRKIKRKNTDYQT